MNESRVNLPQPRDLQEVVRDAEAAVATGDESRAIGLLRELVAWVGIQPNPVERLRIAQMIKDPAMISRLVSLPATLQRDFQRQGAVVSTPQGEAVLTPLLMATPLVNLRTSKFAIAAGRDPLADMLPFIESRIVVPRETFTERVMQAIEGKHTDPPGTPEQ